jgi:hypothetical protein
MQYCPILTKQSPYEALVAVAGHREAAYWQQPLPRSSSILRWSSAVGGREGKEGPSPKRSSISILLSIINGIFYQVNSDLSPGKDQGVLEELEAERRHQVSGGRAGGRAREEREDREQRSAVEMEGEGE